MIHGIIGKKVGMTKIFTDDGVSVPVTLIQAGPCTVTQVKTKETDGYAAVQIGFMEVPGGKVSKPLQGHFKKQGASCFKMLREFRTDSSEEHKVGDEIKVEDLFKENTKIKVCGISKGCGFAGVIKRWGFHGSPASHGAEKVHRKPMSAGATDAARVFKGKKSPGRMGNDRVTVRNITVVKIDPEKHLIAIKGAVPGKPGGTVILENIS